MKKRTLIIIVAAALVFAAATAVTVYAYLQNTVQKSNEFTIGEDKAEVTEAFTEPPEMHMTDTFEKVVSVQNTGTSEEFVRVYLDFSDSYVRDKAKIVYTKNGTQTSKSWSEFINDLPIDWAYVSESDATDGALLGGYFYYTKKLAAGQTTPPLMEGVQTNFAASEGDSNVDNIDDFDIVVYTETVQTTEINADGTDMEKLPGFAAVIINEHNPNLFLSGKWFGFAFCSGTL